MECSVSNRILFIHVQKLQSVKNITIFTRFKEYLKFMLLFLVRIELMTIKQSVSVNVWCICAV